jgi:hypothetical protein
MFRGAIWNAWKKAAYQTNNQSKSPPIQSGFSKKGITFWQTF